LFSFSDRVRRTIREHELFSSRDRILIGISGGADSTALACVLADLALEGGPAIVGLAHLDHRLRPDAADDARFCSELARALGLPFDAEEADVRTDAQQSGASIEDAARRIRYRFLERIAERRQASRIAVGHTRDDQAETVLLRLLRGSSAAGLAGIYPRAGAVVRPLLDVTRADVEAYLRERGVAWREDPTNRDLTIPRNRIRHELLPYLIQHFGVGVPDVLARQAAIFRDDAELIEGLATELASGLVLQEGRGLAIDIARLADTPRAVARRIVLRALREVGKRFVGLAHVEAVLELARGGGLSQAIDLPGQRVERRGDRLVFTAVEPDPARQGRRRGRPVTQR
jgi:tRNA(Ile)-lysidine synthase